MTLKKCNIKGSSEMLPVPTKSTDTLAVDVKDEYYNPLEHRNLEHPTSTVGSFIHLLKSCLGSGILSMPMAFKHTGVIPGCFGIVFIGIIATHCIHILVTTSREISSECRIPFLSYTDTCEKVFKRGPKPLRKFSNFVRHFADAAMAAVCLGGTSVYVVFIATSIKDICDNFFPDQKIAVQAYCGMLLLPLILITQIRHLKFLVPFSVAANLCFVVTFGITCSYTFVGLPDISEVNLASKFTEWPLFLSIAIFAMEGINVIMPIENEMAKPESLLGCPGVLNIAIVFALILYGFIGLFGYLKYGDAVKGSITLNLPQNELPALTAKILIAVSVFCTYCLQMYAPMDIMWTRLKYRFSEKYHNLGQIALRTISVCFTVTLAVAIPDLALLIELVGAVFFSTLGLFLPAVIQSVHCWEKNLGKYSYILWKNGFILVFYFIVLTSGCYSAISNIIEKFR